MLHRSFFLHNIFMIIFIFYSSFVFPFQFISESIGAFRNIKNNLDWNSSLWSALYVMIVDIQMRCVHFNSSMEIVQLYNILYRFTAIMNASLRVWFVEIFAENENNFQFFSCFCFHFCFLSCCCCCCWNETFCKTIADTARFV